MTVFHCPQWSISIVVVSHTALWCEAFTEHMATKLGIITAVTLVVFKVNLGLEINELIIPILQMRAREMHV